MVTGYSEVTSFESGDSIYLKAERTAEATPDGETAVKEYEYVVSYKQEADGGSTRTDTVTNTRKGGVAVRLFKWNSTTPLKNGKFTLSDSAGNVIGKYTSDSEGTVTMMYNFSNDEVYTLTETAAPDGYVGLLKTLKFKVNSDETVTLLYEDGITPWGDTVEADENWAKWKNGENGITAYVDIYNKPFNLKLQKTDGASNIPLSSAHFALYKQVNSTVGGLEKNKNPMSGFEDLVTVNGKVDICGGNSGRVLRPGTDGTVYFLKETKAPEGYNLNADWRLDFQIREEGVIIEANGNEDPEQIIRADLKFFKVNIDGSKQGYIPFLVQRLDEEGNIVESHVILSDKDGWVDTTKTEDRPKTADNVNKLDAYVEGLKYTGPLDDVAASGNIWFGEQSAASDNRGSLIYATYKVTELQSTNNDIEDILLQDIVVKDNIPHDYAMDMAVGSFAETVRWWLKGHSDYTPEQMTDYLFECIAIL